MNVNYLVLAKKHIMRHSQNCKIIPLWLGASPFFCNRNGLLKNNPDRVNHERYYDTICQLTVRCEYLQIIGNPPLLVTSERNFFKMNNTQCMITVGVGDLKITQAPNVLKTLLGSCIGIVLYDPARKIGGLLHVMLPKKNSDDLKITKYANTGLPYFIHQIVNHAGASRRGLYAKIFGGAKMFETNGLLNIGELNEREVRQILEEESIRIVASRTGGTKGYNIALDTETGDVTCRIFGESVTVY